MSQKKKFQIPHVFVILVMIVIFATAMTYILPVFLRKTPMRHETCALAFAI